MIFSSSKMYLPPGWRTEDPSTWHYSVSASESWWWDDEMTELCCFAVSVLWSSGESFSFWGLFECSRVSITAPPIRHQKVLGRRRYSDWTMFRGSFQADLLLQFQDFVTRVLLSSSSQAIWCISMQGSFPSARMGRPSFATPTVWLVLEGWRDAGLNLAVGEAWRWS